MPIILVSCFLLMAMFASSFAISPSNCTQFGSDECGIGGKCIENAAATASACVCYQGYRRSILSSYCEDINECSYSTARLCARGFCINMDGSYYCGCFNGYVASFPDGKTCQRPVYPRCGCSQNNQNNQNNPNWMWSWFMDKKK